VCAAKQVNPTGVKKMFGEADYPNIKIMGGGGASAK
jgi:hypothetical protein